MSIKEALGIDIGGVIISRERDASDTSFSSEEYLDTPEVADAFEVITRLVTERFEDRVFLVSKCGPRVQAKTRRWLKHHRFFERTCVKPKNVYFCLERSEKGQICRRLKITHFIDDRVDVLESLNDVSCFLFDPKGASGIARSSSIRRVRSWNEIAHILLAKSRKIPAL
jgi:hypothetical protein